MPVPVINWPRDLQTVGRTRTMIPVGSKRESTFHSVSPGGLAPFSVQNLLHGRDSVGRKFIPKCLEKV